MRARRIATIRERSALYRQVQEFFHTHLIGLYRWDEVSSAPADLIERIPGKPLEAGKSHDKVDMQFGPFDLLVLGPFEDENWACGMIRIRRGVESLQGPLDATTWIEVAEFIKQHNEE